MIAPEYSLNIQAQIPTALCAIHNFIRVHDPDEATLSEVADFFVDDNSGSGFNPAGSAEEVESEASMKRDQIAEAMWDDYQHVLAQRAMYDSDDEFSGPDDSDEDLS